MSRLRTIKFALDGREAFVKAICAAHARHRRGGRDDGKAGFKGRGVWSNTGNRTPFPMEGGKGTTPKIVHFQMRPDPLAR